MATDEDYRKFRRALRAFCYGAHQMAQKKKKGEKLFPRYSFRTRGGKRGENSDFTSMVDLESGWSEMCGFVLDMQLVGQFNSVNTRNSTYINARLTWVNIQAAFSIDGMEVTHMWATYKRALGDSCIELADRYPAPSPGEHGYWSVDELGLDDLEGEPTAALRELLDTFEAIWKEHAAMEKINQNERTLVTSRPYKMMKALVSHAANLQQNIIFHGAPGTGKTYTVRHIIHEATGAQSGDMEDDPMVGFVQFHPSYDYTDFVEGLRPSMKNGKDFELVPGIFMQFCARAGSDPDNTYYFLIDEINRGNISNIFGELFFLLDASYRADGVTTQYSNLHNAEWIGENGLEPTFRDERFIIPPNVVILGTMNDIDRSVDSFDFAMRRRFRFKEITWKDSSELMDVTESSSPRTFALFESINNSIAEEHELGPDYALGASYFRRMSKAEKDNPEDWINTAEDTWNDQVKPLIDEYLRGIPNAKNLLGRFHAIWRNHTVVETTSDSVNMAVTPADDTSRLANN